MLTERRREGGGQLRAVQTKTTSKEGERRTSYSDPGMYRREMRVERGEKREIRRFRGKETVVVGSERRVERIHASIPFRFGSVFSLPPSETFADPFSLSSIDIEDAPRRLFRL